MYYRNKLASLQKVFGTSDIELLPNALRVGSKRYPILDDVIILTEPARYCPTVRMALGSSPNQNTGAAPFAEDIQYTFGAEWQTHGNILPEHEREFSQYFDLVDLAGLREARVADLGCGSGRWSYFLKDRCRELVLVDFSDAIFVARRNLAESDHCLFFNADLTQLPFANDAFDFTFCLGVLHHLPIPCLQAVRDLQRLAPRQLVFLYYALDNRPAYFRILLAGVTRMREKLAKIRSATIRSAFSWFGTLFLYLPLVMLGHLLALVGLGRYVPLYEFYRNKSVARIRQDVYDRFFTGIEQRVSREEIGELQNSFVDVRISENLPYWHFLLSRR